MDQRWLSKVRCEGIEIEDKIENDWPVPRSKAGLTIGSHLAFSYDSKIA